MGCILVREPFPDPNIRRPSSMSGSRYFVLGKKAPAANVHDPTTQSPENRNAPTVTKVKLIWCCCGARKKSSSVILK